MGPAVKTPADIIVIRETVKENSDSKEMQRTATAGFFADSDFRCSKSRLTGCLEWNL